jgi:hypothetical protein
MAERSGASERPGEPAGGWPPPFRKRQGEAVEGQQLAEEGLGGRHPNLDAGADIQNVGHQPPKRTFRPVGNPQQVGGKGGIAMGKAPLLFHRQGGQGVGRFTRLGHPDREGAGDKRRRRIAEFARVKDAGGDPSQLLQQVGAHQGRMAASAAGQDLDALHALVHRVVEGEGHQGFRGEMAGHPQGCRFGLLVDLLEHEVAEAALVGHMLSAAQQARRPLNPLAFTVVELDPQRRQQGHLPIFERQDRAGETGQGGGVTGTEKLPFTQADQQGRLTASHHQSTGHFGPDHRQGIGPMQPGQHLLHRLEQQGSRGRLPGRQQLSKAPRHQVGNHFGVRIRAEHHPCGLQLLAQAAVVLDDAVLNHRQSAAAIEMGVGVALLWLAMGGPAGVADAAQTRGPLGLIAGGEVHQFAFSLQTMQAALALLHSHCGDPGRVVTAVFELAQAIQQLGCRLARTNQGNDAAHRGTRGAPVSLWADGPRPAAKRRP